MRLNIGHKQMLMQPGRSCHVSTQKKTALEGAVLLNRYVQFLALASFELALRLVDNVDAAFATHNAAITVPVLERAERVLDLHGLLLISRRDVRLVNRAPQSGAMNSWWAILGSN